MRLIGSILKGISGLLILFIPFLIIYWILSILEMEPTQFLVNILGGIFLPFLGIIESITNNPNFDVADFNVKLSPIILTGILLATSAILNILAKVVQKFDETVNLATAKTKVHMVQKQKEEEKKEAQRLMMEKSIAYVVVRHNSQTTSSAYLVSSGLSHEDITNMFKEHVNKYQYHDAELAKQSTDDNMVIIFDNVAASLTYALNIMDGTKSLNLQLDKAGTKLDANIGIYSTSPTDSKANSIFIANKICNLSEPGEISVSKTVKDIFMHDRVENTLRFTSKGMYDLGEEVEIFAVKRFS